MATNIKRFHKLHINLLHTSLSNFLSPCLEKEFSTDTITNIIRCKLKCTVTLINTINLHITMFLVQPFLLLVDLHTIIYTLVSFKLQPCIVSRYFSIIDVSLKEHFNQCECLLSNMKIPATKQKYQ